MYEPHCDEVLWSLYQCGGCLKVYLTKSDHGPTRETCPRCNDTPTGNKPIDFGGIDLPSPGKI